MPKKFTITNNIRKLRFFANEMTQQELADLVGASRPVTSTILNRLRGKGVLGYNREYVCVRDIDAIGQLIGE